VKRFSYLTQQFLRRSKPERSKRQQCLAIAVFVICSAISLQAQIQSGYFVAPSDKLSAESRQYLDNKIRVAMNNVGAITSDGYFPIVTVLKYSEIEVLEISGMRTMYKSIGEVSLQVIMDAINEKKPSLLGVISFKLEGAGTSKQNAMMTAIRNINIPETDLKSLYQRVEVSYKQAAEVNCNLLLQEAKQRFSQKQYQESIDAAMEIAPTCSTYKAAQQLVAQITEEYSERRLREAQQFFTQGNYDAAAEAASNVLKNSKSFAAAQKILTTIVQRKDAKQKREDAVIASDKAAERSLERLRITTSGEIAKAEARSAASIARSRVQAEERYGSLLINIR